MPNGAHVFVYDGGPIHYHGREIFTHVNVNEGVTSIPDGAFQDWSSLKSLFIADGVTSIGDEAFLNCKNLISIRLPDSLQTIGDNAFSFCNKLANIRLPQNIISMGTYSFQECSSLSSIAIPSSMTSIVPCTFYDCKALSKVIIPTSVSTIGDHSFYSCYSITSIKLHDTAIRHIYYCAFQFCSSLLSVQVPPSTIRIGNLAFGSCTSLKIAYFPSTSIEHSDRVFGRRRYQRSNPCNPNLILLTDRDDFVYHDYDRDIPTLTLRAIQQCIHNLPNINNYNDDDDVNGDYTSTSTITTTRNTTNTTTTAMATIRTITATTTTTIRTRQQQQLQALHQVLNDYNPDIAQKAQQSGLNILHLLVYFPGDILQPLTMLLDKCPLVTTTVDSTGRTPFHHTITSTQQNMDCACYDLLASRTPDKVVHLAIRSRAPWHEVHDIMEAKVNGLDVVDEESGLMPFMMIAVEDETEEDEGSDVTFGLTAVYELLCMKPDVIKEYVDVGSACGTNDMETCVAKIVTKRRRLW